MVVSMCWHCDGFKEKEITTMDEYDLYRRIKNGQEGDLTWKQVSDGEKADCERKKLEAALRE
jgi:hypothetical protein